MNKSDLLKSWKTFKPICVGCSIEKIVSAIISIFIAKLIATLVNLALSSNVSGVFNTSLKIFVIIFISMGFQTILDNFVQSLEVKAINKCKIEFLTSFLNNPLHKLYQTNFGDLIENINDDIISFTQRYSRLYPIIISSTVTILICLLFLFVQNFIVSISLLIIGLLQLFPSLVVKKFIKINYEQCRDQESKITNHILEAVNGFDTIKLYGCKLWWQKKMSEYHRQYLLIGRKTDAVAALQRTMYRLLDNILKYGTYMLMGLYVLMGRCSIDVAIQAIYISSTLFESLKSLFALIPEIAVSRKAEARIKESITQKNAIEETFLPTYIDSIELLKVSFMYENHQIFQNTSYCFRSDLSYLIQSENGTGKSTILKLIVGLIRPNSGRVLYNGTDSKSLGVEQICLICQNDPSFNFDSETLLNMCNMIDPKKFYMIAKKFRLTEEILKNRVIGELSGGERKKLFLSIGFSINSQWLLLDEPSNNLDKQGKQVLLELVRQRKSVIVVSHDPDMCQVTDCVLKIKDRGLQNERKTDG